MKILVWLLGLFFFSLHGGSAEKLTFEGVYLNRGDALLKPLPDIPGWLDDLRFVENRDGKWLAVDAGSGRAQVLLDPQELKALTPLSLNSSKPDDHNADYSRLAFLHQDDIYVFRKNPATVTRITATVAAEKNPVFSPDGRFLAYTAAGNLFVCGADGSLPVQVTSDGSDEILNGYASWVYYEEILGRASRYRAFDWSPDSGKIAFLRFDQSRVPQFPLFDASGPYGRLEMQRYPKAGFPNPTVTIGVFDLATRRTEWIAFPDSGDHYLTVLDWSHDSGKLYLQWMNRGQDDWKLFSYSLASKKIGLVYREQRKTWVDALAKDEFFPMADESVLLLSSKSGWNHLYRIQANGLERMITSGPWSVRGIEFVDEKKGLVFFSADKEDSTRSDLYRISITGGAPRRVTSRDGTHAVTFSKNGSFYLDRFSSLRQPPSLSLCSRAGRPFRVLGESLTANLRRVALGKAELFKIPAADGLMLPAGWILPPDFDAKKKYPVILSIYGGPDSRSVIDAFPRRLDDYFLAQQGIIVLKVDHRGSGHFGRKMVEAMHRCLGKWELADYGSAVAYLRTLPFIDGTRIGITGGSYGGYVAALAMAAAPDLFCCGIAEFGVMDWSLYDSVYSERYMDLPAENPDGYQQSSVLSHMQTYRGNLLLTHGSMDDNVHMQNTLQLLNGLLDLGKPVELMIYPGERHGVRGKKAVDEARINLEFWQRKLLAQEEVGPVGPVGPVRQEKKE
ncbi:MAG: DPP IV N-terminal domain-containing protein [Candidatus Aminicenantes bacterium]|nr:DPP IV N-terminal domain-containing protein [Candidatus Aminicenantes bacterium]